MEEALYKQCKICGKFYDVRADRGERLCNECYLQKKVEEKKNDRK